MPIYHKRHLPLLLLLTLFGASKAYSQKKDPESPPQTKAELEKAYEKRIKQEYINEVYIPKDLTDAFIQLNKLIDEPSRKKFKEVGEEEAARKLHFSLGRWIAVNWGFYEGSRLSKFISGLGIDNPDDMSRFVIVSYHRNLNRKALDVKSQVEFYKARHEKEKEERVKTGEVIHESSHKKKKDN